MAECKTCGAELRLNEAVFCKACNQPLRETVPAVVAEVVAPPAPVVKKVKPVVFTPKKAVAKRR